jgi:hypothetical protein
MQIPRSALLIWMVMSGALAFSTDVQHRTLVVNGHSGDAAVVQVDGRTYIDLESLVRITSGTQGFQNNQIVLTLPVADSSGKTVHTTEGPQLSRDFRKSGIEVISLMREWASPLANAIQNGFPVTDSWVHNYREQAASGLRTASAAVSTSGDQSAYTLLSNEFDLVQEWSNKLLEARKSMSAGKYALSPGSLQNEPLSQKILACAHFLGPMLASGNFQDDSSCH